MKKLFGMLLAVAAALPGQAVAQGPIEMIAYDDCQFQETGRFHTRCG